MRHLFDPPEVKRVLKREEYKGLTLRSLLLGLALITLNLSLIHI